MWCLWLCVSLAMAADVVLPTEQQIELEADASGELAGAVQALRDGDFDDAGRRLEALAAAGGDAGIHWLAGIAWYEAGQVHRASQAVRSGLGREPGHAGLSLLDGLIKADAGRGDEALKLFDRAAAAAPGDVVLQAQVAVDRGLVHLDRGETEAAGQRFGEALALAREASRQDLIALAERNLGQVRALEGRGAGGDPLAAVSDALARGDLAAARAAAPTQDTADRRGAVRRLIADGTIARAEGRYDVAVEALTQAIGRAREAGLIREEAAAVAQLGVVQAAISRFPLAREHLEAAVAKVAGTSFRVSELSYRVAAARVAVRQGDLAGARAHLAAVSALAGVVRDAAGAAGAQEALGLLEAAEGDVEGARRAYAQAWAAYEGLGSWAEAARVATSEVELLAGRDPAALADAKARAARAFGVTKDPLGPVHVGIAEGLGLAREKQLDGALDAFVGAAKAAEPLGPRGARLAALARENAGQALVAASGSEEARARASQLGLDQVVSRYAKLVDGQKAYDAGLTAYEAGAFAEAVAAFDVAVKTLESIDETGYAKAARRGRAWAEYNASVRLAADIALPVYQRLVEEGVLVQDPELRTRSMAAAALALAELKRPEARASLASAASHAESFGLGPVAGQCFAELVELEPTLPAKVAAAESAYRLRDGDEVGRYAIYEAALAAYEAEAYPVAVELSERILPKAGKLADAVREVRDAAKSQL